MNPLPVLGIVVGLMFIIGKILIKPAKASSESGKKRDDGFRPSVPPTPREDAEETEDLVDDEIKKEQIRKLPTKLRTPRFLEGLLDESLWTKYVKSVISAGQMTISPNYNLGMFLINMRTLQDYGYAKNVVKQNYKGKQVWKGDFTGPYSLDKFLSDANLQYEVFLKMTHSHYKAIVDKYGESVKSGTKEIDGVAATLSGLLAVAKFAGLGGLAKWYAGDRKKATTDAFLKSNDIF